MERSYLKEVESVIKSLVISSPIEVTVERLNQDFQAIEGYNIPYMKLGFENLECFLRSISDTIKVSGGGPLATVRTISNQKSSHILQLVGQQKKEISSKSRNRYHLRQKRWHSSLTIKISKQSMPLTPNVPPVTEICYTNNSDKNKKLEKQFVRKNKHITYLNNLPQFNSEGLISKTSIENIVLPRNNNLGKLLESTKTVSQSTSDNYNENFSETKEIINKKSFYSISKRLINKREISYSLKKESKESSSCRTNMEKDFEEHMNLLKANEFHTNRKSETSNIFIKLENQYNDSNQAVPEFAANNLVFRVDFPENTVLFGQKIKSYELPFDFLKSGELLPIRICQVYNPFKFWFHIQNGATELESLMNRMEIFYKGLSVEEFRIPSICINPGQICAALYNRTWHRGKIVSLVINGKAKVLFFDYGTISSICIEYIKYLPTIFSQVPTQAIRGCLSHIKPRRLHWSIDATNIFFSMVKNLTLYGQVSDIDELNETIYLILCDTNGKEDYQLNKKLVRNGYALLDEEWLHFNENKSNQRIRHLREVYPTFDMIEKGEYPSFSEITEMQNNGIDFENIVDHITFHPGQLTKHKNVPESIRKLSFNLLTTNPFRCDIMFNDIIHKI